MAIIINEFEIIPDDAQSTEKPAGEPEPMVSSAAPPVSPADIETIVRHQAERDLRLRAH